MATEVFLGIDLGTSSVNALVVDAEGAVRGMGSAEYPTLRPHPGWAEQDPETWWEATAAAVQQAVGWLGAEAAIAGVGIAGQMHGTVFLGENDAPLTPACITSSSHARSLSCWMRRSTIHISGLNQYTQRIATAKMRIAQSPRSTWASSCNSTACCRDSGQSTAAAGSKMVGRHIPQVTTSPG